MPTAVATTIIFPARNDSWIVGAASRSYYADLLAAGVRIFEYQGGLLHTKSLTVDGELALIGSANMDRRSFELNFEVSLIAYDREFSAATRALQRAYEARSRTLELEQWRARPRARRLLENAVLTMGPLL